MKNLTENDNQFYPTPPHLKSLMFSKVETKNKRRILDPSAGKGDLLSFFKSPSFRRDQFELYAIEIDPNLQKILKHDGYRMVDSDFLAYNGIDKYDLIIMNPPFKNGEKHLLHALNFVIDGQIVCILNAETLKNPYSNTRKDLLQRLDKLNAEIEYHQNMFIDAERSTDVEIALINIKIENTVEQLFNPSKFQTDESEVILDDSYDIKKHGTVNITELIDDYNREKEQGIKVITDFFVGSYGLRSELKLFVKGQTLSNYDSDANGCYDANDYKPAIQKFSRNLKRRYWETLITLPKFEEKLTSKAKEEFLKLIIDYQDMEFSENNINILYENLISFGSELIDKCINSLFDKITHESSYYPETRKNIYLYNGWKTNNGFKINKKFILPMNHSHWSAFWSSTWETKAKLEDIEKVFTFFNNGIAPSVSISDKYVEWAKNKTELPFENELFMIRIYKKCTVHITVKDDNLLRRFNVYVGKQRQWLPPNYAMKMYDDCSTEEKQIIDEFEGEKSYQSNLNDPLLANLGKSMLMIEAA